MAFRWGFSGFREARVLECVGCLGLRIWGVFRGVGVVLGFGYWCSAVNG